jgi:hypothetical protein
LNEYPTLIVLLVDTRFFLGAAAMSIEGGMMRGIDRADTSAQQVRVACTEGIELNSLTSFFLFFLRHPGPQLTFADGTVYAGEFVGGMNAGSGVLSFPDKVRLAATLFLHRLQTSVDALCGCCTLARISVPAANVVTIVVFGQRGADFAGILARRSGC